MLIRWSSSASSGFSIFSYGSALRKNYLSLYGTNGGYLNASVAGYWTISDTTGDAYGIDARLGIVGKHNDNTSYALRVQNSDSTDIFHVSNDTTTTVEKNLVIKGQAYTELHTGATIDGIDWDSGNVQEVTLPSGSSDFDPSNAKAGATYILKITQPSGGDGTINWDNMNSALCFVDQYRIQYREVGASSWSQKTMSGPVGSCNFASQKTDKLILNLTANTNYEYQMKAWYCGGGASSWSAIETFTTLDNCPNVGNLAVYGATPTKATFTWDASNGVCISMPLSGV